MMKQGSYYLTEDEHKDFKAKCAKDGISITDKIKDLIQRYINNDTPEVEKKDNF